MLGQPARPVAHGAAGADEALGGFGGGVCCEADRGGDRRFHHTASGERQNDGKNWEEALIQNPSRGQG